ncbi:NCS1 nucleoside transporter family [Dichomitus squalens]|uniref:NCS1 nucleoside transporter family n=1 Tax=Dichomitus squalens TaxID=114155 RepID=A0A4V2K7R6_9APHY|nr:NCS1 nucleoside transporter family [Dichomitus squalens]
MMRSSNWVHPSVWVLEPEPSTFAPSGRWSNKDMDPVPPEKRTWSTLNYVAYWVSDAWNVAVWQLASSMLTIGLSWRQALLAIAVGHVIISIVMVLNGTIGARLHVGFPVLLRSSFGFWFSYFSVISRMVLSMFWLGIQAYTGSQCVYQMLKAIWPSIARMPNHLPPGANVTTPGLLCFFLYWLFLQPFMFVSPQRIRWLFMLKAFIVPPAWVAILIWAFVKAPTRRDLMDQHSSLSGSALSYAWLTALNSALGIYATLAVNIPDFTRYAKNERAQYIQLLIIPSAFTLVGFIGIAVTSAGTVLYGKILWNPLLLIDHWDNRAAAFFASLTFALATLGTNVSANTISAANDMTVLFPRYINIKRGQTITAVVAPWAFVPWEILSSAKGFLSFMNGYTVFLGPFAGIMVADYWIIHHCRVDVPSMYRPYGRYWYTYGFNWRAVVTILVAVPPNIPGLIAVINPAVRIGGTFKLFDFAWLFGFFASLVVYSVLSLMFPARETFIGEAITDQNQNTSESDGISLSESKESV